MQPVSLTTFMDFISKAGGPKMTVVRQWKHKDDYSPLSDFYKRFRETVAEMHEKGRPLSVLDSMLMDLTDRKKKSNYPEVVKGYKKWCGKHQLHWFAPPAARWRFQTLEVTVNPEIGLVVDGAPHLIKLYLKGPKLAKSHVNLVTNLMALTCTKRTPKHCVMGVLDVRHSRLFTPPAPDPLLITQLEGEAAYWCQVFDSV